MKFYPPYSLSGPLPSAAELAENEDFWKHIIETEVNPLLRLRARSQIPQPDLKQPLTELRRLHAPLPIQARVLAPVVLGRAEPLGRHAPAKRSSAGGCPLLLVGPAN